MLRRLNVWFLADPSVLSPQTSSLVRWACWFYLGHIIWEGKIACSMLGAFGAIFCVGWALARRELRFSTHILYFPLALFGVATTLSSAAAESRIHEWGEPVLWFKMLIFPAALILFREVPAMRRIALRAHIAFALIVSAWGLFEFFVLDRRDLEHRITGPLTHVMTFSGLLLAFSLTLLILWWRERKGWQLAATILVSFTLLLTFTRSVWIGWLAAVLVMILLTRPRLLAYAAPALLIFVTFMPMNLFARLASTFDSRQSSNLDRIRMLEAGVEMIKDHPVFGVGPANVKEVYPLYKKHDAPRFRPPHLHNNIVQLWAERGILGLVAYLLLLALFLRECARAWKGPNRMWAEMGVAVTVGLTYAGLFEFNFGDTEVFYLMLDLFALFVASMASMESNEPQATLVRA